MVLILGKHKPSASQLNASNPRSARPNSAFFRQMEEATLYGCLETIRKVATREWVMSGDSVAIVAFPAKSKDRSALRQELDYLERSEKTLAMVLEVALSIRQGRLQQALESLQAGTEMRALARNAERFAHLAFGTVMEIEPEKESNQILNVGFAGAVAIAVTALFAAAPGPMSGIGLAASWALFFKSLHTAYEWSGRHLNAAFLPSKSTGYAFVDRLARLSDENLGAFAAECRRIIGEVRAKADGRSLQLSQAERRRPNGLAIGEGTLKGLMAGMARHGKPNPHQEKNTVALPDGPGNSIMPEAA